MKTLLLPLDERPCNYTYPQMIAASNSDIHLFVPGRGLLGDKKQPADTSKIANFLYDNIHNCTNVIISIDMLVYGGLIPSRLHHINEAELLKRLECLKKLKKLNPDVRIYAFNCIMRTPQYDSSDEEPDYYRDYGFALFRRKYLMDYGKRHGLTYEEQKELDKIKIPQEYIHDYEKRREVNMQVNIEVVNYLEQGVIDFLVIPQDDSSPYGYTAISQKQIIAMVRERGLDMKAMIYPGADEVALSLLTRAYHDYKDAEPAVYPFYASVLGPTITPLYEDRPMFESLKSHIRVCKARLVATPQEADFVLAINSPGKFMEDTYSDALDVTHYTWRNVLDFAMQIRDYVNRGRKVAVCDSALCNGGDIQLVQYLDQLNVLDKLISYAGWNTNCNTLGTTLAQACIGGGTHMYNLLYRIIEDVGYQAVVRHDITANDIERIGADYYDISGHLGQIGEIARKKLQKYYNGLQISQSHPVKIVEITHPWKRLFEIAMKMEVL